MSDVVLLHHAALERVGKGGTRLYMAVDSSAYGPNTLPVRLLAQDAVLSLEDDVLPDGRRVDPCRLALFRLLSWTEFVLHYKEFKTPVDLVEATSGRLHEMEALHAGSRLGAIATALRARHVETWPASINFKWGMPQGMKGKQTSVMATLGMEESVKVLKTIGAVVAANIRNTNDDADVATRLFPGRDIPIAAEVMKSTVVCTMIEVGQETNKYKTVVSTEAEEIHSDWYLDGRLVVASLRLASAAVNVGLGISPEEDADQVVNSGLDLLRAGCTLMLATGTALVNLMLWMDQYNRWKVLDGADPFVGSPMLFRPPVLQLEVSALNRYHHELQTIMSAIPAISLEQAAVLLAGEHLRQCPLGDADDPDDILHFLPDAIRPVARGAMQVSRFDLKQVNRLVKELRLDPKLLKQQDSAFPGWAGSYLGAMGTALATSIWDTKGPGWLTRFVRPQVNASLTNVKLAPGSLMRDMIGVEATSYDRLDSISQDQLEAACRRALTTHPVVGSAHADLARAMIDASRQTGLFVIRLGSRRVHDWKTSPEFPVTSLVRTVLPVIQLAGLPTSPAAMELYVGGGRLSVARAAALAGLASPGEQPSAADYRLLDRQVHVLRSVLKLFRPTMNGQVYSAGKRRTTAGLFVSDLVNLNAFQGARSALPVMIPYGAFEVRTQHAELAPLPREAVVPWPREQLGVRQLTTVREVRDLVAALPGTGPYGWQLSIGSDDLAELLFVPGGVVEHAWIRTGQGYVRAYRATALIHRRPCRVVVHTTRQHSAGWAQLDYRHVVMLENQVEHQDGIVASCRESQHVEAVVRAALTRDLSRLHGDQVTRMVIRGGPSGIIRTHGTPIGQTMSIARGGRIIHFPWHAPPVLRNVVADVDDASDAALMAERCAPLLNASVGQVLDAWYAGQTEAGMQLLALLASGGADVGAHQVRGMAGAATVLTIYAERYDTLDLVAAFDCPEPTAMQWLRATVAGADVHPALVAAGAFCHLLARHPVRQDKGPRELPPMFPRLLGPLWPAEPVLAQFGFELPEHMLEQLDEDEGPDLPLDFDPAAMEVLRQHLMATGAFGPAPGGGA
jgi:hypothetical protein